MSRPTVLVTDGEQRAALAVVRSLGKAGDRVVITAERDGALAPASRFASVRSRVPPMADRGLWLEAVSRAVRENGVRLIVPVTEPAMLALLEGGPSLDGAVIAGPSLDAFKAVSDKAGLLERAAAMGIDVPRQAVLTSPDEIVSAKAGAVGFPLVIKPSRSTVVDAAGRLHRTSVAYAGDAATLEETLAKLPPEAYPLLLQERVRGPGIGVFALIWDGRRLARFAHRRIREKPPSGGVSVCAESVALPPMLEEQSFRLLEAHAWQGVAMVEYKRDEPTGRMVLMEVNGRFWGSLQLAVHAGVDFPRLLVEAALGQDPAPVRTWKMGLRNHWEWGEVDAALLRMRRPEPVDAIRSSLPRVLRECLALRPGRDRAEVFRLSDPLPFLRETVAWFRGR